MGGGGGRLLCPKDNSIFILFFLCGGFSCISSAMALVTLVIQAALARGVTCTRQVGKVSGLSSHGYYSGIPPPLLKRCRHNVDAEHLALSKSVSTRLKLECP